ncbi:MAG: hypothetical protein ACLFNY_02595, partial [Candidatus Aenigmatarchaeota archaeon]
ALDWAKKGREKVEGMVKEFENAKEKIDERKEILEKLSSKTDSEFPDSEQTISEAEKKLMSKEYDEALSMIEDFDETFDKEAYEHIMEDIDEFEKLNRVGEELGVEKDDLSKKLEKGVEKTKSSNYIEAAELVEEGKKTAKERVEEGLEKSIDDIRESLKRIEKIEDDAKEKIQDFLGKAQNKLGSERYRDASRLTQEAEEELDLAQIGSAEKHIQNAEDVVDSLESMEIDTEDLDLPEYKDGIEEARDKLEEGEAYQAVQQIDELMGVLNEHIEEKAEQLFGLAKKETVQARKTGVKIDELREQLIECKKRMKQNNYLEALREAFEVKERAIDLREERERAYQKISDTASMVSKLKKDGKIDNITEVKELLIEAKEEFRDRDYDAAVEKAENASNMMEGLRSKEMFEKKKDEVEEKIERVDEFGLESTEIKALKEDLEEVSEKAEEESYDKGVEELEEIRDELDEKIKNILEDLLDKTEHSLESAEKLGMETKDLWEEFESATSLKEEGEYWESLDTLTDCQYKIQDLQKRYDEAERIIERIRDKLQDAENIKADVDDGKKLLEEAEAAFEEDRYDEVIKKVERAEEELERAQKERVEDILEKFKNKVGSLRGGKIDTALADNLIHKAEKAKERGDYKEAINYSMQSEGELEKIELQQSISRKSIATAQNKLKEAESKGIMVDNAEKILTEAKRSYQGGFYVKAFDEALKSGQELNDALKAYEETHEFLEYIDVAISGLERRGEEVDELSRAKEEVEKSFQNGNYIQGHTHIKKAEDLLDERKQAVEDLISDIESRIEAENGDEEGKEVLERARTVLEMGRPLKVIKLIDEAKDLSGLNKKEKYESKLEEAEDLVEKAKKFGASVETVRENIKEAKAFAEKKDVDEALKKAEDALENVEKALEPYSPKLEVEIPEPLTLGKWNDTKVMIENTGKGFANGLDIDIRGGEIEDFDIKDKMKAGEKFELEGRIKPIKNKAEVIGKGVRVFDQKELESRCELKIKGEETEDEKEKEEKICDFCDDTISAEEEQIYCTSCGGYFHEKCVKEGGDCPICGKELKMKRSKPKAIEEEKEEKKEKKKRRRVDMGIG